ncbi:MAG: 3-dehydroquinate synthase [Candidatus Eremiobacter antarcticus]|nr:3-dehydroquinate synthase [Candidatus Eremiobacteraeota bacterium]MBC5808885.1 3-dehydroquinate synthase [Candidatus Eremiobacteraeota bacterium]PZR60430.1 MAG: 3-dehydroquinate synthase [Candidatus Eremiobacter sp. RRmetagenome_bin22]
MSEAEDYPAVICDDFVRGPTHMYNDGPSVFWDMKSNRQIIDGLPYSIVVSADAAADIFSVLPEDAATAGAAIAYDANVAERALAVAAALRGRQFRCLGEIEIDASERRKKPESVTALQRRLLALGADRATILVAVGGGALTDLAGFAAAAYMRGIRWLPVATTVLGMVDATIGSKTGVNLPEGKNLVGAFWDPVGVLADLKALQTLPLSERKNGMAEIIKAGVIASPMLVESARRHDLTSGADRWEHLIVQAARIKTGIVRSDPRERGARASLNLGHTFGHALERASNYRVSHGAAVAMGLRAAGVLARDRTGWSLDDHRAVLRALRHAKLPLRFPPTVAHDAILQAMASDKKRSGGELTFVLPVRLGEVRVGLSAPEDAVRAAIAECAANPGKNDW